MGFISLPMYCHGPVVFYAPMIDLACVALCGITNCNSDTDNIVTDLYRRVEIVPAVDLRISLIVRHAVEVSCIVEDFLRLIQHV